MAVKTNPSPKSSERHKGATSDTRFQKHYDFKEEQIVTIFKSLLKRKKIKLPESRRPEDAAKTEDPNYFMYHRMVHHPTTSCYILKDKIQALLEAGVMKLQPEQKTVTTNMVTMRFGKDLPEVVVIDGVMPIPRATMRIVNNDPRHQKEKGMVQFTTPSGQTLWVHPDLLEDEQ